MSPDVDGTRMHAVLDASAMVSYARPHVHVGELISEITDEGAVVGVPAVALLDAYARLRGDLVGRARLEYLAAMPGVRVLPLGESEAARVSTTVPLVGGDLSRAHAVRVAVDNDAYYVTTEPKAAPPILEDDQVHAIPVEDA
jgi:hypothetical protein